MTVFNPNYPPPAPAQYIPPPQPRGGGGGSSVATAATAAGGLMGGPVGAAIVGGGAQLVGGVLNGKANKKAMQIQDQASRRAEAIAIDNEKRRREEYDRAEAMSKAQWDAREAQFEPLRNAQNGLLGQASGRLGLNLGQIGARPYQAASGAPGASTGQPRTLAQLAGSGYVPPGLPEIQAAPKLTIADIANWGSPRRMA